MALGGARWYFLAGGGSGTNLSSQFRRTANRDLGQERRRERIMSVRGAAVAQHWVKRGDPARKKPGPPQAQKACKGHHACPPREEGLAHVRWQPLLTLPGSAKQSHTHIGNRGRGRMDGTRPQSEN